MNYISKVLFFPVLALIISSCGGGIGGVKDPTGTGGAGDLDTSSIYLNQMALPKEQAIHFEWTTTDDVLNFKVHITEEPFQDIEIDEFDSLTGYRVLGAENYRRTRLVEHDENGRINKVGSRLV